MKKFFCLLLVLALVAIPLISCADDSGKKPSDGNNGDDTKPSGGITDELKLPTEHKYGGEDFNIIYETTKEWNYFELDFDEPSDTDFYANAIYMRNTEVEELLDINIVGLSFENAETTMTNFNTDTTGNGQAYQACFNTIEFTVKSVLAGNVLSYDELPWVNLDKSWWNTDCTEQLSFAGKSYMNSGDIMLSDKECIWAVYFLKDKIKERNLDNPYDLVANNEWTWDKMMEMADAVHEDANADDVMTINSADIFGLCTHYENYAASWMAAGLKLVEVGDDGMPQLAWGSEEFYDVFQDILKVMTNEMVVSPDNIDWIRDAIKTNKTLFGTEVIAKVRVLRQSENDFGILPYPKYNSNVERYNSYIALNSAVVTTSYANNAPEKTSVVLEAMAAYGAKTLLPEYYDRQLKYRDMNDKESSAMLDIIFEYRAYDLGVFCKWGFSSLTNKDANPQTLWAANGKTLQKTMEKNLQLILNR